MVIKVIYNNNNLIYFTKSSNVSNKLFIFIFLDNWCEVSLLDTILAMYHSINPKTHRSVHMPLTPFEILRESIAESANDAMISSNIITRPKKICIYDLDVANWYSISSLEEQLNPIGAVRTIRRRQKIVQMLLSPFISNKLEIDKVINKVVQKVYSKHFFNIDEVIVADKIIKLDKFKIRNNEDEEVNQAILQTAEPLPFIHDNNTVRWQNNI